ncbi:MAG: replication initiation protein, partial [Rhizobiales bacterium]|nr:replication initiation protein [Hyphomicrobiales bacterium]
DRGGEVEEAFGFSFAPLLYRANEIAQTAERVLADAKLLKRTRERITLQRRDLAQMFEAALEETPSDEWKDAYQRFRAIVNALPRRAPIGDLEAILEQFTLLRAEIDNLLISIDNVQDLSVNERQYERQQYESLPESLFESKNIQKIDLKGIPTSKTAQSKCVVSQSSADKIPLDMVLRACPDIRDYAPAGISCWRDLIEVSRVVSGFLGIARSAYLEASQTMSLEGVSAVVAWLLQRAGEIQAPGGYLRSLTQKARGGGFSIVQVLMTGLKANAPRAG